MKKQKILLIGDLSTANNLGAIATSRCLKNLLYTKRGDAEITFIDHRSFIRPTPTSGWPEAGSVSKRGKLRKILSQLKLLDVVQKLRSKFGKSPVGGHVPAKFADYEAYIKEVIDGKRLQYEYSAIKNTDIVIINGEGNIVHGVDEYGCYRIGARYLLFLAYLTKKVINRPCALINHTVDPDSTAALEMIKTTYPYIDYISVREPISVKKLNELEVTCKVDVIPDALFSLEENQCWKPSSWLKNQIDFSKPYICIGDSSGIRSSVGHKVKWDVEVTYTRLIDELRKICPKIVFIDGFAFGNEKINRIVRNNRLIQVNIANLDVNSIYHVLKRSELFISGRWHASILALLGNTPIILWGADSHKTKALLKLVEGYPDVFYNIHEVPIFINEIIKDVKMFFKEKEHFRDLIKTSIQELRNRSLKMFDFLDRDPFKDII